MITIFMYEEDFVAEPLRCLGINNTCSNSHVLCIGDKLSNVELASFLIKI